MPADGWIDGDTMLPPFVERLSVDCAIYRDGALVRESTCEATLTSRESAALTRLEEVLDVTFPDGETVAARIFPTPQQGTRTGDWTFAGLQGRQPRADMTVRSEGFEVPMPVSSTRGPSLAIAFLA